MTNRLALFLGAVILALLAFDMLGNDGRAVLFLLRKFADFIEYVSFWR
jgi:hypothetical protein